MVGHSHIPCVFASADGKVVFVNFKAGVPVELDRRQLIVNPGGVGQPRDHDPRASYALYDSVANTVSNFKVRYDIASTQEKMKKAGLPEFLISRLSRGL